MTERTVCSILVVDDEPNDACLAARAIRSALPGCHVRIAHGGAEALTILLEQHQSAVPFSLVLLDWRMPGVSGMDVLRRIRADPVLRRTPVVVFTGSTDDEACVASYGVGANSYVRKPTTHESYTAAVIRIGEYWLGLNSATGCHRAS